ncbi:MAG: cell division topological specificity factor MinE [Anaerolineae bacterium]|nr:cell division topological specificity factor MinE [Anaerolineae bacterium]
MGGLLDKLFGKGSEQSAQIAKDRLQLVLVHDRTNLSEERLAQLKDELVELISRYVEIDAQKVDVFVENDRRASLLVANIPLVPNHRVHR